MTARGRQLKDSVYGILAGVGKAVASPVRVELLDLLSQGVHTVEDLASLCGQTLANVSQHLQVLLRTHLVLRSKDGLYARYRIAGPEVGEFVRALRLLSESQAVQLEKARRRLIAELPDAEAVDRDELVRRVREGEAFVIDVRPGAEYRAGHLPGALSIPLEALADRMSEIPRDRDIVAYCRGPYCALAVEAVRRLRDKGFRANRLDMGVWDWRAEGLPMEQEPALAKEMS